MRLDLAQPPATKGVNGVPITSLLSSVRLELFGVDLKLN